MQMNRYLAASFRQKLLLDNQQPTNVCQAMGKCHGHGVPEKLRFLQRALRRRSAPESMIGKLAGTPQNGF